MELTINKLDEMLARPAFTRCPKISYQTLLEMKRTADFHWDAYWDLGMYEQCIRYTKISQRILEAMLRHPNKLINETKNR